MRYFFLLIIALFFTTAIFSQPCTTTNASGCLCADGRDTCALLPDLTISWFAILNYMNGPNEYSQSGNGANDGRLRITGSTPNLGFGSFTVRGSNYFLCGTDTIFDSNRTPSCPDGSNPTNLLVQRVYKKMGNTMTYEDRWAGGQTFHPTHGHNHVDDWVVFTLREEDPNNHDTLSWAIVGEGAKIGFCLMDYGSCSYYNGHCRTVQKYNQGTVLTNSSFPNYGLGGGSYNCSPVEQGISSGYTDIYDETLDGMWINIPPNICNGKYWIVAQVDPLNHFLEADETNNWTAVPYTLTKQTPAGSATASITLSDDEYLCNNDSVTLTASIASSYLWSNGATTRSITVADPGNYSVQTTATCGSATSPAITIQKFYAEIQNTKEDTSCIGQPFELGASGNGTVLWFDEPSGGNLLDTGNIFYTPNITETTTYYAAVEMAANSSTDFCQPTNHSGSSQYSGNTFNSYIIFDVHKNFTLKSVKVYSDRAGTRIIELRNASGNVLQSQSVNIPTGTSRINLNFEIPAGTNYQLGTNGATNQTNFGYTSPRLRRTSSGVSYPYTIPGVVSLKNSDNGTAYYYYFYDWEVETQLTCTSPRMPVTATVGNITTVEIADADTVYYVTDADVTLSGIPAGGAFSGPGITGDVFSPSDAGVGGPYLISYEYLDTASGCAATDHIEFWVVDVSTKIEKPTSFQRLKYYPNPAQGQLTVELNSVGNQAIQIEIVNMLGMIVYDEKIFAENGINRFDINISSFARGVYQTKVTASGNRTDFSFVKQY